MKKTFYAVAALVISSPGLAQSDSSKTLNEVVVSATKYPAKTSTTGKVVVVINRQDIERAGSRDLSQLINEQGGLYINGANSNPGKDRSIYLRGARVDHTLITIDGVPVYDATGIGSNFDLRQIPIESVERIEVLKGSQGTLYGSDAIAGVINIITRKGNSNGKPVGGNALLSYGSYNTVRTAAALNGKRKNVDYNVGYNYFSTKGISEAEKSSSSTATFDRDGSEQQGLQASVGIQATPKLRIAPYLRYNTVNGKLDADALVDDNNFRFNNKVWQAGVRNDLSIGSGRLALLYNYTHTDRDYRNDSAASSMAGAFSPNTFNSNEHYAEGYFVKPFGALKLTAGADFRSSNLDLYNYYKAGSYIAESRLGKDSTRQNQAGVYAALAYSNGGFNIEGGGRYNHHSRYGSNFAFNVNPSYLFRKQWKVFANISTGYRTPSLYQLYSPDYGNETLQPEESLNIEGGIQYFTKDEKAYVRATYFNRAVEDLMVYFFNPVSFQSQYINRDKQKDKGFELDGKIALSDKINIKAFYSYADGEITTKVRGKDTTYFNLYRRPKQSLAITLGSAIGKKIYLSAQLNAVGKSLDLTFPPPTYAQTEITLKSYVLLNLYGEYALARNRLKIFADMRNVTDEKYNEVYGYATPGVNAYGGIRFTF